MYHLVTSSRFIVISQQENANLDNGRGTAEDGKDWNATKVDQCRHVEDGWPTACELQDVSGQVHSYEACREMQG